MRWLAGEATQVLSEAAELALVHKAIQARPHDTALHTRLGEAWVRARKFRQAAAEFELAASQDPERFEAWAALASCYLQLEQPEAALDACDRGTVLGATEQIHYQRGCALRELHRFTEARNEFLAALALDDCGWEALKALLAPLATNRDGGKLLEFCAGLSPPYSDSALVRGHRAIALSRLGRTEEALQLVDLFRHVARIPVSVPHEFIDVEQFNRALAEEILNDPSPVSESRGGFDITYAPQTYQRPAIAALLDFIRDAIVDYIDHRADRGLDTVLPPPPENGSLFGASVVLRGDGSNGEHLHAQGYVSSVYHVQIPDCITTADDNRGALALGCCDTYTMGYSPCWGKRYIKPVAGWLLLFPSHIFHDVVPSQTPEPRISVAADLKPAAQAGLLSGSPKAGKHS